MQFVERMIDSSPGPLAASWANAFSWIAPAAEFRSQVRPSIACIALRAWMRLPGPVQGRSDRHQLHAEDAACTDTRFCLMQMARAGMADSRSRAELRHWEPALLAAGSNLLRAKADVLCTAARVQITGRCTWRFVPQPDPTSLECFSPLPQG